MKKKRAGNQQKFQKTVVKIDTFWDPGGGQGAPTSDPKIGKNEPQKNDQKIVFFQKPSKTLGFFYVFGGQGAKKNKK